jgi:16S rRNA C967 or C1407 C5-methylase (RsmB/RsmF family)
VELQRQLLHEARGHVTAGGRLFYATCSLLRAENEHTLEGREPTRRTTLWPHLHGTDGFHWAEWEIG